LSSIDPEASLTSTKSSILSSENETGSPVRFTVAVETTRAWGTLAFAELSDPPPLANSFIFSEVPSWKSVIGGMSMQGTSMHPSSGSQYCPGSSTQVSRVQPSMSMQSLRP
jgi:hypothetical protein